MEKQGDKRKREFKEEGDKARLIAEEALKEIDEALEDGVITQEQHEGMSYEISSTLHDRWAIGDEDTLASPIAYYEIPKLID